MLEFSKLTGESVDTKTTQTGRFGCHGEEHGRVVFGLTRPLEVLIFCSVPCHWIQAAAWYVLPANAWPLGRCPLAWLKAAKHPCVQAWAQSRAASIRAVLAFEAAMDLQVSSGFCRSGFQPAVCSHTSGPQDSKQFSDAEKCSPQAV